MFKLIKIAPKIVIICRKIDLNKKNRKHVHKWINKCENQRYTLFLQLSIYLTWNMYEGHWNARTVLIYRMQLQSFSDQFRKIIIRHKCIGYDLNDMRQSVC